jgi:urease alpha subunit
MKRYMHLRRLVGLPLVVALLNQAHAESVLVRGGTLIDGTGSAPVADASVLITDGMITNVWSGTAGAPALPDGTQIVDAAGKFIIPGLIDSHVHYAWWEGELFINHGVTSIYSMGGGNNTLTALRKGIDMGQIVGPRMFASAGLPGGAASRVEGINPAGGREIREGPGVSTPTVSP